jgi:hypothetical protein
VKQTIIDSPPNPRGKSDKEPAGEHYSLKKAAEAEQSLLKKKTH